MKKNERIKKYGEEAYDKLRKQIFEWQKLHPENVERNSKEQNRKGGKYYEKHLEYNTTGLPREKHLIRRKHARRWRIYKNIIAPWSVIHHEWIPRTSNYTGVALVEKDQHQHGYIDVIRILDGKITLLTEKEIKGEKNHDYNKNGRWTISGDA